MTEFTRVALPARLKSFAFQPLNLIFTLSIDNISICILSYPTMNYRDSQIDAKVVCKRKTTSWTLLVCKFSWNIWRDKQFRFSRVDNQILISREFLNAWAYQRHQIMIRFGKKHEIIGKEKVRNNRSLSWNTNRPPDPPINLIKNQESYLKAFPLPRWTDMVREGPPRPLPEENSGSFSPFQIIEVAMWLIENMMRLTKLTGKSTTARFLEGIAN